MVDGEGDCASDKGWGGNRYDPPRGSTGPGGTGKGLDGLMAITVGRGNGQGEGTDRRRLRLREHSQLGLAV